MIVNKSINIYKTQINETNIKNIYGLKNNTKSVKNEKIKKLIINMIILKINLIMKI